MKRSEVREHIFKIVFRAEFYPQEEWKEQIEMYTQLLSEENETDCQEIEKKANEILESKQELDEWIEQVSEGWNIKRIGKVELAILRLAIFEMKKDDTIPVGVAINEAVELAKNYGTDKSASFVNGLLAKLV